MSKRKQRHYAPRDRLTVSLTGTVRTTEAGLDHSSAFAMEWALAWLSRAGSKKLPKGGLIRRALAVYVRHLETCQNSAEEVRAITRACSSLRPDKADQAAAWQRLESCPSAEPLPGFLDLLQGPDRIDMDALDARVESVIQAIAATPWGRLKGIK